MCGNHYITEVAVKSFQQPVVACTRVCSQPHRVLWSPYTCVRFRYGAEQCVVKATCILTIVCKYLYCLRYLYFK